MTLTTKTLFSSPLVDVADHSCTTWAGRDDERCDPSPSITIIRRGLYAHHTRHQVTVADPGLAMLYRRNEPYCLSHPFRVGIFEDQRNNNDWFPRYQACLHEHQPPALIVWGPHDGYMPEGAHTPT